LKQLRLVALPVALVPAQSFTGALLPERAGMTAQDMLEAKAKCPGVNPYNVLLAIGNGPKRVTRPPWGG